MKDTLTARLRQELGPRPGVTERKMFGGTAFLLNGNMCCGVTKDGDIVLRIGAEAYDDALKQPDVRECDFTGHPLRGMVMLDANALHTRGRLKRWVWRAADYAAALPKKRANA